MSFQESSPELHIPYSQLKPLVPVFDLIREAAHLHIINEYDGYEVKNSETGRRNTRAQYLDYGRMYGPDRTKNLLTQIFPSLAKK